MKRNIYFIAFIVSAAMAFAAEKRISRTVLLDKLEGGWLGQIVGVTWGGPTEWKYSTRIMPEQDVPAWREDTINDTFNQDDLYVEMTFIRSMEQYGTDVSIRQAGIDFANSEYPLWWANKVGRNNLRMGIAPPDSSHPEFHRCPNAIDYQIEADYSGLLAPGMPQATIAMGEKFGRLVNYGDGLYGGQFIGGMLATAYFTDDIREIIDGGLACIPAESQYAQMVRDMLAWHAEAPRDWQATWGKAVHKYLNDKQFLESPTGWVDVRINGAMVLLGLLYGEKDLEKTIVISMRGGFDSDCNPSSAGGVVGVILGRKALPERFVGKLDRERKFLYTAYDFNTLIQVSEKLIREFVVSYGGRIEIDADGEEVFVIPEKAATPSRFEPSWQPGPVADVRFTDEEMAQIKHPLTPAQIVQARLEETPGANVQGVLDMFFPGWKASPNGRAIAPGYVENYLGRNDILRTCPMDSNAGAFLWRTIRVPKETPVLSIVVACEEQGGFDLVIRINGKISRQITIQKQGDVHHWETVALNLGDYVSREIEVSLENHPNGNPCAAAYWAELQMVP